VAALQVELTVGESARLTKRATENLDAYLQFSEGRAHYLRLTKEDNERARRFYERATELDPEYTNAWLLQAMTHQMDARFGWSESRTVSYKRVAEIVRKAQALDENHPGVQGMLSIVYRAQRKMDEAVAAARKAVALAPSIATFQATLAIMTYFGGEFEESIALTKKAMRLHPRYPAWYLTYLGVAYRMLGRYEEAVAAIEESQDRLPRPNLLVETELAATYSMMGREQDAQRAVAQTLELFPKASLKRMAKMQYFKDPAHLERILDALRNAGLPEQ
jgi:tetratricopeptide (TPR) repeat protein